MVIKALDPDWIRIRIGIHPKKLDPDPDEMNADPQPWLSCLSREDEPVTGELAPMADDHHVHEVALLTQRP